MLATLVVARGALARHRLGLPAAIRHRDRRRVDCGSGDEHLCTQGRLVGIACLSSARLPVEALLIGPGTMVAGVAMLEWDKRELRGQQDRGSPDTALRRNAR